MSSRLRFWTWRRRALVCRDAVALMTAYLEDNLSRRDRERLETHLAACPHCHEYLAQLRAVIEGLRQPHPDDLTDEALDGLVDLYRRWQAG